MELNDIDISKRYHYAHLLNEEEKRLYRFMVECILNRQFKFFYLTKAEIKRVPSEYKTYPTLIRKNDSEQAYISLTYDSLFYDFPEFFFLRRDNLIRDDYGLYFDLEPELEEYRYTSQEIDEILEELDNIYHSFDHVESGFPLEEAVHSYIIDKFDYDHATEKRQGRDFEEIFTVAGLIKRGVAVCAGFSKLAQYIFTKRGMEAATLVNYPPPGIKGHCWLAVKLDGKYYHLDITDSETMSSSPDSVQRTMFNITDKELMREVEYYYPEKYPGIVCNSTEYNYYRHKGLYFKNTDEVLAGTKKFIEENSSPGESRFFYFRTPQNLAVKKVTIALGQAICGLGLKKTAYINYRGYYSVEFRFPDE